MPYIKDRKKFQEALNLVALAHISNPGELNYLISMLLVTYIKDHGLSYPKINDCLGALSGAEKEFYRRIAAEYENKKIQENGDIYWDI